MKARTRLLLGTLTTLVYSTVTILARAEDTTPFQCERLTIARTKAWVAPILRDFCEKQEALNGQAVAKILGKPRPSAQVYLLPAYGSSEAKHTGLACVGGTAMRKLPNGWEQLRDRQHNWVKCRDVMENAP